MILLFLGLSYPALEPPPPQVQNEPVASHCDLAPPTPSDCMYVCLLSHPSIDLSVHLATSLSVNPSVCPATSPSMNMSLSDLTCPTVTPPIHPAISPLDHLLMSDCLDAILPHPSDHPSLSDCSSAIFTSLSDHLSPPNCLYNNSQSLSACPSLSSHLTKTMTHPTVCPSSNMIQHMPDSSQSLAVMNGSNPASSRNPVGPFLTVIYFYVP